METKNLKDIIILIVFMAFWTLLSSTSPKKHYFWCTHAYPPDFSHYALSLALIKAKNRNHQNLEFLVAKKEFSIEKGKFYEDGNFLF